jgi:carbon monoxide dehydrogenase subunit G
VRGWALPLVAFLLALAGLASAETPVRVSVTRAGDTYVCSAELVAPVRLSVAWEVLTDFDHMADWVPNLRQSRLLKREGDVAIIEQVGLAQFGFVSFNFTTERRLELKQPVSIHSVQTRGNVRRYVSLLHLAPEGAGTRITYHAEVEPGFLVAVLLSREFLEHEVAEQLSGMVGEMVRRGP